MLLSAAPIETDRLTLSPLVVADAVEMVDVLGDERMHEFTGGHPLTLEALTARYRMLAVGHAPDGSEAWLNWIVRLRRDGAAVGVVQATVSADGRRAEVAWEVGVAHQGRGFASEAAAALVGWLGAVGADDVSALIHRDHTASALVAARAGLRPTAEIVDDELVWTRRPA